MNFKHTPYPSLTTEMGMPCMENALSHCLWCTAGQINNSLYRVLQT